MKIWINSPNIINLAHLYPGKLTEENPMNEKNVVEAIDENKVLKPTQHLSLANELSALLKQFNFEINADGVLSPKN